MVEPRRTPAGADSWDWQLDGACRGADGDLFFHPEGERGPSRAARERAAKAVCATCHVLERCRQYSLANREPYGVWGGLSETERDELLSRAQRRRVPPGTPTPGAIAV